MQPIQTTGDSFACCSRYQQCSDAKKCIIPDEDYSQFCGYRTSLENGKIFFGKNSINFSHETYKDILSKINSLSDGEKTLLDKLYVYCRHNKCMRETRWTYSAELENLYKLGLIGLHECRDWVLTNFKSNCIETLISDTKYFDLWNEHKNILRKNDNFVLKDAFISWIKQNAPDILAKLDNEFRLVSLPENGIYADEYIKDFSVFDKLNENIINPIKNDTRFLKINL